MVRTVKRNVTSCPECRTHFYITAEQLAARKGFVKCGYCHQRFNARDFMLPVRELPVSANTQALADKGVDSAIDSPLDNALVIAAIEDSPISVAPEASLTLLPASSDAMLNELTRYSELPEDAPVENIEDIDSFASDNHTLYVLDQHQNLQIDKAELVAKNQLDAQAETANVQLFIKEPSNPFSATEHVQDTLNIQESLAVMPMLATTASSTDFAKKNVFKSSRTKRASGYLIWRLVFIIYVLLTIGQILYYCRSNIASQMPSIKPYLEQACNMLGCIIELPKDILKINIDDSDLKEDATYRGLIHVSATIINQANVNLMYPNLELTLTDEDNKPILRRVFKPSEYLPSVKQATIGLPPNQETLAYLNVRTVGTSVIGYQLLPRYD